MKELKDNPKPPQELFAKHPETSEFVSVKRFYCGDCGTIYVDKEMAAECCKQDYCECGNKLPKFWTMCGSCRDLKRWEKAEEVMTYKGMLTDGEGNYFNDMEEYLDINYDVKPEDREEFLFCTTKDTWAGLDARSALENSLEDYCGEDGEPYYQLVDEDKLLAFVDEWNKRQDIHVFREDSKRKVKIPWEEVDHENT